MDMSTAYAPSDEAKSTSSFRREVARQINGIVLLMTYGAIVVIGGTLLAFRYPLIRFSRAKAESEGPHPGAD